MKISTRRHRALLLAVSLVFLSVLGCSSLAPPQLALRAPLTAAPLVAQQQWRVTVAGVSYPLLAVVERAPESYRISLLNNFGMRVATLNHSAGAPQVTAHMRHPLDKRWLQLLEAYQWAFWPSASFTAMTPIAIAENDTGRTIFRSVIVQAEVEYSDSRVQFIEQWQGQVTVMTEPFTLDIQSYVISPSAP